jgi:hypothetical protein
MRAQERQLAVPSPRAQAEQAKTAAQTRACESQATAIQKRSQQMVKRADTLIEKFDAITTRVKEFYAAQGITVSNYQELVDDIDAKKAVAKTAAATAQTNAGLITCASDSPRQQVQAFSKQLRETVTALNAYKRSVRNLIVAVHSQAPETEASALKASPKAKPTPRGSAKPVPTVSPQPL